MSKTDGQIRFDETHHALLFGWIGQAIVDRVGGQRGEAILRKVIRRYGEQRGRRMALRARANKHILSMANYLAYSEYRINPGAMDMKIIERSPHCRMRVSKCPWYEAWNENSLQSLGRLYCLEIDRALVRGFNPALTLDVRATMTSGDTQCEFVYHDANLRIPNYLLLGYRRAFNPGLKAVMPWDYHVGHLYNTFEEVAAEELGQADQEAIQAGLAEFLERYGEQAMQKVLAGRSHDYNKVPEG